MTSEFSGMVADILLTEEFLRAAGRTLSVVLERNFAVDNSTTLGAGSATPGQWGHVTFAPAGIGEIPPSGVPEPAFLLLGSDLVGLAARQRMKKI